MTLLNQVKITVLSNESVIPFLRTTMGVFCVTADPTVSEIEDVKTAVSELITNCVVHAYPDKKGVIDVFAELYQTQVNITVADYGVGIKNIDDAMQPFYSTLSTEEHCGMGLNIVSSFMDDFYIESNNGTTVKIVKKFSGTVGENA